MLTRNPELDNEGLPCSLSTCDLPSFHKELGERIVDALAHQQTPGMAQASAAYAAVVGYLKDSAERRAHQESYPDPVVEKVLLSAFPPEVEATPAQASLVRAMRSMWTILTEDQRLRWEHLVVCQDEQEHLLLGLDTDKLFAHLVEKLDDYERNPDHYRSMQRLGDIHRIMRAVLDSGFLDNRVSDEYRDKLLEHGWSALTASNADGSLLSILIRKGKFEISVPLNTYSEHEIQGFLERRASTDRPYGKAETPDDPK